jgi:hypothetical protein
MEKTTGRKRYEVLNMSLYTVSLFGHREIADSKQIEEKLIPIIQELLRKRDFVQFYIGRNGEFDEYAASLIKIAQRDFCMDYSDLTLVLPYEVADMEYYEKYYDDIIIPECLEGVHPKSAISKRNRWMVEKADLLIVYTEKKQGGAYTAMRYAEKLHIPVINLASTAEDSRPS